MMYGRGRKQKEIIKLGKQNKLTYGDIVDLYGYKKSIDVLEYLEEIGLISIDEESLENDEFTRATKILWNENSNQTE